MKTTIVSSFNFTAKRINVKINKPDSDYQSLLSRKFADEIEEVLPKKNKKNSSDSDYIGLLSKELEEDSFSRTKANPISDDDYEGGIFSRWDDEDIKPKKTRKDDSDEDYGGFMSSHFSKEY